jgi:hypothetical protein
MGYFSNGTEGDIYERQYCFRCVHENPTRGCPVMSLHLLYAYGAEGDMKAALNDLIPRKENGIGNEKCTMFITTDTVKRKKHDKRQLELYGDK